MQQEMSIAGKPRRASAFREVGLLDDKAPVPPPDLYSLIHVNASQLRPKSRTPPIERIDEEDEIDSEGRPRWDEHQDATHRPRTRLRSAAVVLQIAVIVTVILCLGHFNLFLGAPRLALPAVDRSSFEEQAQFAYDGLLQKRANSPTNVCKRWSHQSAVVNGTLYIYGGRATTSSSQTSNTWNNDFITIDLKKSWQISSPAFNGLPQPSGPPPVANGYLWSSYDSLYLYGGEYSDNPVATPDVFGLWEYDILSSSWREHSNPTTSAGINSEPGGVVVQGAAEGSGFSVKSLGQGWYFGGHLDFLTSPRWSIQTPRVYLRSFIEYTFPGYTNPGVDSLANNKNAGADGAWRNITNAGIQDQAGFTERADGLIVWVPGWGADGILLSLGGGTNQSFSQMNIIDVYDVANSTWYRQATSGPTPKPRVNPCAVVAASADGSSYSVYMFGGQNLLPTGEQVQYSDMWILSVPSLIWIQVNTSSQSTPYPRAGHTCNIWDGQMVVVGGYIGQDISCEFPGVYVFNTSSLEWVNSFTSLTANEPKNPFSQQENQIGVGIRAGIEGSYDYAIPEIVYDTIGGDSTGGATYAGPVVTATAGPMATGKPIVYTITASSGAPTGIPTSPNAPQHTSAGTNIGATVAGVIAGVLFLLACYLAFCAYLYRKQLQLYKRHVALQQEQGHTVPYTEPVIAGFFGGVKRGSWKETTEGSRSSASGVVSPLPNGNNNRVSDAVGGTLRPYSPGSGGSQANSREDLMEGMEPNYWGVLLHPRRSLRVINR